jgi:hypothetical protein
MVRSPTSASPSTGIALEATHSKYMLNFNIGSEAPPEALWRFTVASTFCRFRGVEATSEAALKVALEAPP